MLSMGTSPIMPCYDAERLETKTYVGLGPGESIEYTKHGVSLEGHPWPGCRPEVIPGVHIVKDRPRKKGLEECWSSEPKILQGVETAVQTGCAGLGRPEVEEELVCLGRKCHIA